MHNEEPGQQQVNLPAIVTNDTHLLYPYRILNGSLLQGRQLTHPFIVLSEYDDETDEFVVSEPQFHMHASASTEKDAIEAFKRIFSGYLDILSSQEEKLGPHLRKQLEYLRSHIREV